MDGFDPDYENQVAIVWAMPSKNTRKYRNISLMVMDRRVILSAAKNLPLVPYHAGTDVPPVRIGTRTDHAGVNRCRSRSFVSLPAEGSLAGRAASSG